MIFASDLDRTLIFSERALAELGHPQRTNLKPVEERDGKWLSYMTANAYYKLEQLCLNAMFVPVTTRTTEQFRRIFIFRNELPITYAITSNGANILYKGELLPEWSGLISRQMKAETCVQEELLAFFQKEGYIFNGVIKQAENLFFYYILEKPISLNEKLLLGEAVSEYGWRVSQQGRKLYFIPKAISKGVAIEYICGREGKAAAAGAGDAVLDWDFLQHCRHRFVPAHGELVAEPSINDFTLTINKGVLAGEEIVRKFISLVPQEV